MSDERLISADFIPEEDQADLNLRPARLQDYIGQEKVKENIAVFIAAAKERGETLDHVLLSGPPGLGKTTLARDRKSTRLNSSHLR